MRRQNATLRKYRQGLRSFINAGGLQELGFAPRPLAKHGRPLKKMCEWGRLINIDARQRDVLSLSRSAGHNCNGGRKTAGNPALSERRLDATSGDKRRRRPGERGDPRWPGT